MSLTDKVLKLIKLSKEKKALSKQQETTKALEQKRRKDALGKEAKPGFKLGRSEEIYDTEKLDKAYLDGISKASDDLAKITSKGKLKLKTVPKRMNKGFAPERLHKVIARAGLYSNRKAEELIRAGRVSVNGEVAVLGQQIDLNDPSLKVRIDGQIINHRESLKQPCQVLIYHKSEGEISSRHDPEGRKTVFDRLPRLKVGRWVQVGRLDINTSGLLLFTNDGQLAHRLMHPAFNIERRYLCRVYGEVTDQMLRNVSKGVQLEDGFARFDEIKPVVDPEKNENVKNTKANSWFEVTLKEGRKHEVRRIWESQGIIVSRLIRIEYAGIELSRKYSIPPSGYLEADLNEINLLRGLVGLPPETEGFRPEDFADWSKSEAKRQKALHLRKIRKAIAKDKAHRPDNTRIQDEKNKEQHEKRKQLAENISQRNKRKFKSKKDLQDNDFVERFYK